MKGRRMRLKEITIEVMTRRDQMEEKYGCDYMRVFHLGLIGLTNPRHQIKFIQPSFKLTRICWTILSRSIGGQTHQSMHVHVV